MQLQEKPRHIAIIMDGNRRWAKNKGFASIKGHLNGLKRAKKLFKAVIDEAIPFLSLYVFSTENWKRSGQEISSLMRLVHYYILNEEDFCRKNKIRVLHSGDLLALSPNVQSSLIQIQQNTQDFDRLTVNLAINYGGRAEILRAFKRWTDQGCVEDLTEEVFHNYLDQPQLPAVDLIIRTAGEFRISNFMIWQGAYAELVFSNKLWPNWTAKDFSLALEEYQKRQRRFGGDSG